MAAPRGPLPPWPEESLGIIGWDEGYWFVPVRQRAIGADQAVMQESWSGFALVRELTEPVPVALSASGPDGKTLVAADTGAVRFWFNPNWSSVAKLNGKLRGSPESGPGQPARLLELVNLGSQFPDIRWTLHANAEGNRLRLAGLEYGRVKEMFNAPLKVAASQWRLITLCYSPEGSQLWIDGELAASGLGIKAGITGWENRLGLIVGSAVNGAEAANGLIEEVALFDYWPTAEQQQFYFAGVSKQVRLGPVDSPEEEAFKLNSISALDGPPSPGEGGGGGGGGTNTPAYNYDPGTFYVEILSATNQQATLRLHNTVGDTMYELLSKTELTNGAVWAGESPFVLGAVGETSTVAVVPWLDRTNALFVQARSWVDTDGDGLPDWWESAHGLDPNLADTSALGISDGYKDDDGDGWTNLEELQNGTSPSGFNTPPAPRGLTVLPGSATNEVDLTWRPVLGPVQSYTIERSQYANYQTFQTTAAGFTDTPPSASAPWYIYHFPWDQPKYRVRANYAGGSSDWTDYFAPEQSVGGLRAHVVRGPQGHQQLVISAVPVETEAIRLWRAETDGIEVVAFTNYMIAASSFADGVFPLPTAWIPLLGPDDDYYQWWVQPIDGGGLAGTATFAGWNKSVPFFDGRVQLLQNLAFLLRAATGEELFVTRPNGVLTSQYPYAWSSTDFAHAGLINYPVANGPTASLMDWRPFADNHYFRNFVFDANRLNAEGKVTNGLSQVSGAPVAIEWPGPFLFVPPTAEQALPAVLDHATNRWTYYEPLNTDQYPVEPIGISSNNNNWVMADDARNYFGLRYLSAKLGTSAGVALLSANGTTPHADGVFYPETAQPELQTIDYYFGRVGTHTLPGHQEFDMDDPLPLLITSIGNLEFTVAGYAKQAILNGYTNKFAYLGQYFEKAQKLGTTNATGVLSPYGEFLPTEPGPVELVTMPDLSTGQRGTGVVQVIKLQLDVNHDGVMDLSWAGPDNANTYDRPFRFWVNNDNDAPAQTVGSEYFPERDVKMTPQVPSALGEVGDFADGIIYSQRDLEDFARLWIRGMPEIKASDGYSVRLEIWPLSGDPRLRLYRAAEPSGGIGYLTNVNAAASQLSSTNIGGSPVQYWLTLGQVSSEEGLILPLEATGGLSLSNFLFEASGIGKGLLGLSVWKGADEIAQHYQTVEFLDVKDMYEQAIVTNVIQTWPEMVQQELTSGFHVTRSPTPTGDETDEVAVLVHGWRMTQGDYYSFSETMFKRLYWQGFQGRFTSLRWPTRSEDTDEEGLDLLTFNRSEHIAFKSGIGAALYFDNLRDRYPDHIISACSHSQGNIVMMEALKTLVIAEETPLDHYVLMQAAVPAHSYDTAVTNLPSLISAESGLPTPNTYLNYAAGITNALRLGGKIVNFFNPSDFALASGYEGTTLGSWEFNQGAIFPTQEQGLISMKPLVLFGYYHSGTTSYLTNNYWNSGFSVTPRTVTDPREIMPFVARPRSKAVGAQGGVGSVISATDQVDLSLPPFELSDKDFDHSGQFNRNIQEPPTQPFYDALQTALFPE